MLQESLAAMTVVAIYSMHLDTQKIKPQDMIATAWYICTSCILVVAAPRFRRLVAAILVALFFVFLYVLDKHIPGRAVDFVYTHSPAFALFTMSLQAALMLQADTAYHRGIWQVHDIAHELGRRSKGGSMVVSVHGITDTSETKKTSAPFVASGLNVWQTLYRAMGNRLTLKPKQMSMGKVGAELQLNSSAKNTLTEREMAEKHMMHYDETHQLVLR